MSHESETLTVAEKLERCQEAIGYRFENLQLLEHCLTHASVARTRLHSNERLEFLGDAVLGLVTCQALFNKFPNAPEGEMTRLKSTLVSRNTCARVTTRANLEDCMLLGKGLSMHQQNLPQSVKAALFEALIAGVYLDGGLEAARGMVERLMDADIERVTRANFRGNFKSQLQQVAQKRFAATPQYRLLDEKGPDHSKCFEIAAVIHSRIYPAAWGASKKEAEQKAAENALDVIREENGDGDQFEAIEEDLNGFGDELFEDDDYSAERFIHDDDEYELFDPSEEE